MSCYYFDIQDGGEHFIDDVGSMLPNLDAAHREATRTVAGLASDRIGHTGTQYFASITVREGGRVVIKMNVAFDSRLPLQPSHTTV
jgi:hypothetical protein